MRRQPYPRERAAAIESRTRGEEAKRRHAERNRQQDIAPRHKAETSQQDKGHKRHDPGAV
ncbi:hypothetical protein [uncultured Henriciella sp.]|uniref:hypothetical protein n=1 Tax=uncultured Henriciella sp. TaxID=1608424 RepID=UPI0032B201AA